WAATAGARSLASRRAPGNRTRSFFRPALAVAATSGEYDPDSGRPSIVVVQLEFVRMRTKSDRIELVVALVRDPRLYEVLGEDVAAKQKGVVLLERRDRLVQRPWRRADAHVLHFLARHLVNVTIERLSRADLVGNAVEHRHQHGRPRQIAVAARIRAAELQPF